MAEKDKLKKKIFREGERSRKEEELGQRKVKDQQSGKTVDRGAVDIISDHPAPEQELESLTKKQEPKVLHTVRDIKEGVPKFFSIFRRAKPIGFMGMRKISYAISSLMMLFSLVMLATGKVRFGVDFGGGLAAEFRVLGSVDVESIREVLPEASIQSIGDGRFLVKLPLELIEKRRTPEGLKEDPSALLSERLAKLGHFEILKVENVGSIIGRELKRKGIFAFVLSLLGIFAYITLRFEWRFAIGALVALFHDIIVVLGMISVLGIELSLVTLAGLLTLAGYSVNDSVIIADRIRERLRFVKGVWSADVINRAITDTLPRTIITGITTMFPSVCLALFGGEVLKDLGMTFLIGVLVGTYSSIFICAALAYDIYLLRQRKERTGGGGKGFSSKT